MTEKYYLINFIKPICVNGLSLNILKSYFETDDIVEITFNQYNLILKKYVEYCRSNYDLLKMCNN